MTNPKSPSVTMTKRSRQSGEFHAVSRDIAIMQFIYKMGYANTTHIIKVLFPPVTTGRPYQLKSSLALRRLKILKYEKYLNYVIPLMEQGKGRDPFNYYCDTLAYQKVLGDVPKIDAPAKWDSKLRHDTMIRDVFTDFLCSSKYISRIPILEWKSTRTLKGEYQIYIPDWYFSLALDDGNPFHVFLEVDRGEETEKQWKKKLEGINQFLDSEEYRQIYKTYRTRFAIVAQSYTRVMTLLKWSEEAGCGSRFWFTSINALSPETVLTSDIWKVCKQEGLHVFSKTGR